MLSPDRDPADLLAEKRRKEAAMLKAFAESPAWGWFVQKLEQARTKYLAHAMAANAPESYRLQASAIAYFCNVILEEGAHRVADLHAVPLSQAVEDLPRPPRSSDSSTLV